MKQLLKKKISDKKGFTLAELLVVVAIIAILVAISVPIFMNQMRKARLATNQANARSARAAVTAELMDKDGSTGYGTYNVDKGTTSSVTVTDSTTSTTGSGTINTNPSEWKVDKLPTGGDDLINKVATDWTVYITDSGASYTPTYAN